jgi:DNA-binding transcriptional LysR family regulator
MVRLARALSLNLAKAAPQMELRLQLFRPAELSELLLTQQVDLVVGPTVATEGGVCSEPLSAEPFAFAMREGHPLLHGRRKTKTFTLEEFLAWPHLLISPSGRGEGPVDTALRLRGLQRRVSVRVSSFLAAAEIVATTDMLLTAPRSSLEGQGLRIVTRLLPFPLPPIQLRAYWEARRDQDPRLVWLRDAVTQAMAPFPVS